MYSYRYDSSAATGLAIGWIIGGLITAIIFGLITKHINESKGYTGGFAWGFWLSIIGIIVVACKPDNRAYSHASSRYEAERRDRELLADGGWKCLSCGRVNNQFTTYCICGKTKEDSINPPKSDPKVISKQASQDNETIALIKQLAELHSQGILTDEEFTTKKASLLAKIGMNSSFPDDIDQKSSTQEAVFLEEIADKTSMMDIWKLWRDNNLAENNPEADEYIKKYKEIERLYGRLRDSEVESVKEELKQMLKA